ncbi:hypothetical protein HanRHA438_Chr04g0169111 [Helianthus annuus]|nr:hypothetical protein HanPI659440_Chr04g0156061 [Helianthus annuus]KAJ0926271.1 hypothetical protein HanRHA438_Chr04g0169111 [Helianthus annuus]
MRVRDELALGPITANDEMVCFNGRSLSEFFRRTVPVFAASRARSWCALEQTWFGPMEPYGSELGSPLNKPSLILMVKRLLRALSMSDSRSFFFWIADFVWLFK